MGLYIEACDGLSKEEWIIKHGTEVEELKWPGHGEDYYPVSVIDNGTFRAALVCWLESEIERVTNSFRFGDPRPARFYHVKRKDLMRNLGVRVWKAMQDDISDGHR